MLCTRCGGSLRSASAFCSTCGQPVGARAGHEPLQAPLPGSAPLAPMPGRPSSRRWAVVAGGVALAGLAAGAFLWGSPSPRRRGEVPVLLTVLSNPKTRVKVVPGDPTRGTIDLGDAPLDKAPGAMVGDTVVLENPDLCIRHEETIQFGEPFQEKIIEKIFGEGTLKLTWKPSDLKGLSVWCHDQKIGNLAMPLKLYEGKLRLEIRGEGLKQPVKFDVTIEKDRTNTLPTPVDLTPALDPAH